MFTGLIEDIGTIQRVQASGDNHRVVVSCHFDTRELTLGESVAVDGACFTVVEFAPGWFAFEASAETLARTTLAERPTGAQVHLERAMTLGGRLGGHLVMGHVDAVGTVLARDRHGNAWRLEIGAPPEVARFLVDKGSVTINGVSLTVNHVHDQGRRFDVMIVPFTGSKTLLTELRPGQRVNLEADIIGKYVLKLLGGQAHGQPGGEGHDNGGGGLTLEWLRRHGYA